MTTSERAQMLERYRTANVWLARVYDTSRTVEHRLALWEFLTHVAEPRLKQILITTRHMDEECVEFWDKKGLN